MARSSHNKELASETRRRVPKKQGWSISLVNWHLPIWKKRAASLPDLAALGPDLYSLHRANGEAIQVGDNAAQVLFLATDDLLGAGFLQSVHVQDRVAVAKSIRDCAEDGSRRKTQFRIVTREGASGEPRVRWFELRCQPLSDAAQLNETGLVLAVSRDISERRALEEELRQQRENSESANIAKTQFLANMSHELRTPLNAILGFSELLNSPVMNNLAPEKHREYVALIHSSATHLLTVVNDILDMSKIEAGKYDIVAEPFELSQTIRGICAMLRGQAEGKSITLEVGDMAQLPELTADERAIRQIMINLISNAIKFTEEGGNVRVCATRSGRNVELTVEDDGIGISPEHIDSLGQPFYQADSRYDRKYEGSGLGLSVVYGLVKLHGGSVRFQSRKDKGTQVCVAIPIMPPRTNPVPATETIEVVNLEPRKLRTGSGDAAARRSA